MANGQTWWVVVVDERVKATRLKSIKEGRRQPGRGEGKERQSASERETASMSEGRRSGDVV